MRTRINSCSIISGRSFTFPIAEHRPESLRNLVNTIYSRGQFISKATGGYFYASEEMVENLQSGYHIHMHQVVETIEKAGPGALCGMVIEQDMIVFNGFPTTSDEELMGAWYNLFDAINTTAIKQRHVHPKRVNVLNEKYAFRNWLTSLGMNGPELKKTRWYLYRNLTGNTAFRIPNNKKVVNRV